jgi:hypothetical protein
MGNGDKVMTLGKEEAKSGADKDHKYDFRM